MSQNRPSLKRHISNVDYFTGSQASVYIGDVFIDEVNAIEFNVFHERTPIYGYASRLYDDLTEGHVIIQGQLSINFKEAGYLWLVLKRYKQLMTPFVKKENGADSGFATRYNIERVVNGEASTAHKLKLIEGAAAMMNMGTAEDLDTAVDIANDVDDLYSLIRADGEQSLRGFSSMTRLQGGIGSAENEFETFENAVWRHPARDNENISQRRCDDPAHGSFDIYLTFGDFLGDNSVNHTIIKLADVNILGDSMIIRSDDGIPISEVYSFIARDKV